MSYLERRHTATFGTVTIITSVPTRDLLIIRACCCFSVSGASCHGCMLWKRRGGMPRVNCMWSRRDGTSATGSLARLSHSRDPPRIQEDHVLITAQHSKRQVTCGTRPTPQYNSLDRAGASRLLAPTRGYVVMYLHQDEHCRFLFSAVSQSNATTQHSQWRLFFHSLLYLSLRLLFCPCEQLISQISIQSRGSTH